MKEKASDRAKAPKCETTIREKDGTEWPAGIELSPMEWVRVFRSRRKKRASDPMALKARLAADSKAAWSVTGGCLGSLSRAGRHHRRRSARAHLQLKCWAAITSRAGRCPDNSRRERRPALTLPSRE